MLANHRLQMYLDSKQELYCHLGHIVIYLNKFAVAELCDRPASVGLQIMNDIVVKQYIFHPNYRVFYMDSLLMIIGKKFFSWNFDRNKKYNWVGIKNGFQTFRHKNMSAYLKSFFRWLPVAGFLTR